jgi:2-polyprenyl-6-methoxyphenol hydroxylase-like FAD-dependent oxidoreductase
MNVGLTEAEELAAILCKIIREQKSLKSLNEYEHNRRDEWRQLLGLGEAVKVNGLATSWVQRRAPRILSCLPSSGDDLKQLTNHLGLGP